MKGNKLILKHWDHVMNYPPACEHAMQVINVHFTQLKKYQDDLEKRLGMVDKHNQEYKKRLVLHKSKKGIRAEKHRLVKKKLKSIMAGLNCKHAKAKHELKQQKRATAALKIALKNQSETLKKLRKVAKLAIHKAIDSSKAKIKEIKAAADTKLALAKNASNSKINAVKALAKTLLAK